jgi:hypothetical protein
VRDAGHRPRITEMPFVSSAACTTASWRQLPGSAPARNERDLGDARDGEPDRRYEEGPGRFRRPGPPPTRPHARHLAPRGRLRLQCSENERIGFTGTSGAPSSMTTPPWTAPTRCNRGHIEGHRVSPTTRWPQRGRRRSPRQRRAARPSDDRAAADRWSWRRRGTRQDAGNIPNTRTTASATRSARHRRSGRAANVGRSGMRVAHADEHDLRGRVVPASRCGVRHARVSAPDAFAIECPMASVHESGTDVGL